MDIHQELAHLKSEMAEMKETMANMQSRITELEGTRTVQIQEQYDPQPKKSIFKGKQEVVIHNVKKEKPKKHFELKLGQLLNRLGVIAVVLGLSIFLKYSFDNQWIGATGRVILGIITGLVFWAGGEYTKRKYVKYAQGLLGGGSLAIFFSIYAGYSFYDLYSQAAAFVALIVVMAITVVLSVRHQSLAIGILGIVGAYATPMLVSSGEPSPWVLFGYLTLLTAGVLGVAVHCKWVSFNYSSFIANQFYILLWFLSGDFEDHLGITMMFLVTIFALYLGVSSIYNIKNKKMSSTSDGILIALNGFFFFLWGQFLLQETFLKDYLGFYAIAVACIYIFLGRTAYQVFDEDKNQLYTLFATALVLITIAMPLQLEGDYLTYAWFTEALCLVFIGFKLDSVKLRLSGIGIYILSLLTLGEIMEWGIEDKLFLLNRQTAIMVFTLCITGGIVYVYIKFSEVFKPIDRIISNIFKGVGLAEIFLFLTIQNSHFFSQRDYDLFLSPEQLSLSGLWMAYAIILFIFGIRKGNRYFRYSSLGLIGIIILKAFFVDLAELQTLYKIILFIILGLILLGISYVYQKKKDVIMGLEKEEEV
ncbi:DUF2339 domain-containing protein [Anaerosolibacter sp.]|uniref:DUF2339 domain-containing protein n=1 Tax=Anaerosolibacter sp. TaxID=1872527 RepID=UPI0039F021CA